MSNLKKALTKVTPFTKLLNISNKYVINHQRTMQIPRYETRITQLCSEIERNNNDIIKNKELFKEDSIFELILLILNKQNRTKNELMILKIYLQTLDNFIRVLTLSESNEIEQLLFDISSHLKCEKMRKGNIVCKYGEKGFKYFIVLKGSVIILLVKEYKIRMSFFEYVKHLIRLTLIQEYEFINRTITANKKVYKILDNDFRLFMKKYLDEKQTEKLMHIEEGKVENEIRRENINRRSIISSSSRKGTVKQKQIDLDDNNDNNQDTNILSHSSLLLKIDTFEESKLLPFIEQIKTEYNLFKLRQKGNHNVYSGTGTLSNSSSTSNIRMSKSLIHSMYQKEIKDIKEITVDEYINLSFPKDELKNEENEPYVTLYSYFQLTQLHKGDSFGEIALQSVNCRRTATIMCVEDGTLGTLTREEYNSSIRDIQTRIRRNNIKFLLSYKIFSGLSWSFFEIKLFNFFKQIHVTQGQILFEQGVKSQEIFFLQSGEYELSTRMSSNEVKNFVVLMLPQLKNDKNENEEDNNIRSKIKKQYKVSILKDKEVIGLSDMVINGISVMTVKVISSKGIIFSIDRTLLEHIAMKFNDMKDNFISFIKIKRAMMAQRFQILSSVNSIEDLSSKDSIVSQSSHYYDNNNKTSTYLPKPKHIQVISSFGSNSKSRVNDIKTKKVFRNTSSLAKRISLTSRPNTVNNNTMLFPNNNNKSNYQKYAYISDILVSERDYNVSPFKRKNISKENNNLFLKSNNNSNSKNQTSLLSKNKFGNGSGVVNLKENYVSKLSNYVYNDKNNIVPKITQEEFTKISESNNEHEKFFRKIIGNNYKNKNKPCSLLTEPYISVKNKKLEDMILGKKKIIFKPNDTQRKFKLISPMRSPLHENEDINTKRSSYSQLTDLRKSSRNVQKKLFYKKIQNVNKHLNDNIRK